MKHMKKLLCSVLLLLSAVVFAQAQTTILDFEAPATSTVFQYFGSPLDGTVNQTLPNPNPSGINTSSTVSKHIKPAVSEVWSGFFSNPNPTTPVDLIANNKISINVHMDHIGSVSLKLEGSPDGGDNWVVTLPNTKVNEWETLVFDATLPSIEAPLMPAAGHTYARVVLFFDFGTAGNGTDIVSYFDDIKTLPSALVVTPILDFETPATGTAFQYFGSNLDGTLTTIIDNPNSSGINTSSKVTRYVEPAVAEVWAGAFSNPNPTTLVDFGSGGQVCIKVHMDHIGNVGFKLEGSTSGKPNWLQQVSNTKVNEWEELCFDASLPSLEPPFEAAGGAYARVVLFFDFGTPGTGTDVISYFDDIVVKSSGAPAIRTVNFKVDMNNYAPNFDKVYISGSFNNWSGDANPLLDPEFDGIWEGNIAVPNGAYEYKVTLDNWNAQEAFIGTEECTKKDPSGQFVNRLLLVSGNTDLPRFCFNSCYACGEEVKINFKLGTKGITPNPEGVWIAGGGNFDVPGGKYKMDDSNADGIYELTVPRKKGFNSFFTFTNGPCADYSCKEDLTGLPCGNPNNFNDRFLPSVQKDTTLATCFGACFTNAECVSGVNTLIEDVQLFNLLGNPAGTGESVLVFGYNAPADKTITMTNSIGQVVHFWNTSGNDENFKLQTADLQPGIYFVTVKMGNRYYTRKLIK
jgi:hypothetical protein